MIVTVIDIKMATFLKYAFSLKTTIINPLGVHISNIFNEENIFQKVKIRRVLVFQLLVEPSRMLIYASVFNLLQYVVLVEV